MRSRLGVVLALGLLLGLASVTWGLAQEPGWTTMVISYGDGAQQVVALDQPSCNIQRIEFTSGEGGRPVVAGSTYTDSTGKQVYVPCGEQAFADRVVDYRVGDPAPSEASRNSEEALGPPNYAKGTGYVTLGCGGALDLEFTRVRLVDVDGPDLYVFEAGDAVEPTQLEISPDGRNWVNIGKVSGGKASVDIHGFVQPGQQFRFVRLTDLKTECSSETPGADIDAVAAVGCNLAR